MSLADDIARQAEAAAITGLREAAEFVLRRAKENVPVGDPGVDPDPSVSLRDSGHIEAHRDGYIIVFDTPYAAKIHEDLRLRHPRGGGAKYLERAVNETIPHLDSIVASNVAARMASGLSTNPARPHR